MDIGSEEEEEEEEGDGEQGVEGEMWDYRGFPTRCSVELIRGIVKRLSDLMFTPVWEVEVAWTPEEVPSVEEGLRMVSLRLAF